ncbi:MAG: hypothetical protein DRP87_06230 [Spirochaetes bacterium]|nr:MAG: hypothetical protein DRP87_06230 [Spirochaetota bacterium]
MRLPEYRYRFSSKKKIKRASLTKIVVLILFVVALGAGTFFGITHRAFNFLIKEKGNDTDIYELWEKHNYSGVIESCKKILAKEPMNATALTMAGFAYFYEGINRFSAEERIQMIDRAIINLRKAELIKNRPVPGAIQYTLGKSYFHKGKFYLDLAVRYFEGSLTKNYKGKDTYEYLGLALSSLGKYEESIKYFLKAIQENPSGLLYLTLAQTYYKLDNIDASEEYLIRAINRTQDAGIEEKSRFFLARIYRDRGDYLKAEEQYNKIIEKNPESADAHFNLGEVYNELNDQVKARAEWRTTLRIDPSHYGARLRLYD